MKFICRNDSADHPADRRWNGRVYVTGSMPGRMELEIHGKNGMMAAVIGNYRNGWYICLPDIEVGCPISRMNDTFWNRERLSRHMPLCDAISVAEALNALSESERGVENI